MSKELNKFYEEQIDFAKKQVEWYSGKIKWYGETIKKETYDLDYRFMLKKERNKCYKVRSYWRNKIKEYEKKLSIETY